MIKGGSLLRADGGYLVLNVMDVLQDAIAWRTLIRTLKTRHLQIQGMDSLLSLAPSSMKPQPIDLSVTVILIGETYIYHLLSEYVEDFQRVFKVRADFSTVMPRGKKQIEYYASLAHKLALIENLLQLDAGAVAKLAEQGARKADANGKISARLGEIADILREASYHAQVDGSKIVKRKHVDQAISEAEYRHDLVRERMDEYIENKILLIDTEGESVGQINALAVYDLGKIAFGRPNKVTCEVSIGERGIVNIEREAKLSGKIHDKGVLILEGYLRNRYGTHGTISLSASIAFEQSYGMIDGDSASMAEVIVLTSEVTGLPLRQDLAVTGSINQKGDVQAIGGVNEKVEGFFRVCQLRKLTGTQGVVIPESNVGELMLSEKVLAAIASGRFHVYPVKRVEDALEIFMGVKAGKTLKSGDYTTGSIHDRMLRKFEEFKKKSNGGDDDKDEEEKEDNGKPKKKKIIRK
jgi:ATP-dependent Lon protease